MEQSDCGSNMLDKLVLQYKYPRYHPGAKSSSVYASFSNIYTENQRLNDKSSKVTANMKMYGSDLSEISSLDIWNGFLSSLGMYPGIDCMNAIIS